MERVHSYNPEARTGPADERLACITQTSFHSPTSFMNPFLATMAQNWIIVNSLLTYTTAQLINENKPAPDIQLFKF